MLDLYVVAVQLLKLQFIQKGALQTNSLSLGNVDNQMSACSLEEKHAVWLQLRNAQSSQKHTSYKVDEACSPFYYTTSGKIKRNKVTNEC